MITASYIMVKAKTAPKKKHFSPRNILFYFLLGCLIGIPIVVTILIYRYENTYTSKVYPGVRIDGVSFGGKTQQEILDYFLAKNAPFQKLSITLNSEDKIATLSATDLAVSFDGKLSAVQAYSIGRSGHILSDVYQKWKAWSSGINLTSILKLNTNYIDETLNTLSMDIDVPAEDALFQFENGKVIAFKMSKNGKRLNKDQAKKMVVAYISTVSQQEKPVANDMVIMVPVETVFPAVTTENSNRFGIRELLSKGTSKFVGSIAGRVHNIELAASKINGRLIPAGEVFSFNDAVGDISATTGFQQAYIIKEGRTVLGDGGGVCQVSTTLFRSALLAGLPIVERHAHAYRVSYYEQDSPPGLDATVFAPSYDLKFKNDTANSILIQAKTDTQNYTLTFELYGTKDGRIVELTKPVILSQTPPPPDIHQDDPTLPKDTVKQVDWKAWGAKVTFDYKVTKNTGETNQQTFFSNFRPWQAIFLHGTKEG